MKSRFLLALMAMVFGGCVSSETSTTAAQTGGTSPSASATCETSFNQSSLNMQRLCVPAAGAGRHFRLEGARLLAVNTALYLYVGGYDAGLEGGVTAPATDSGKMRVLLYQGNASPTLQYGNTTSVATTTAFNGYNTAASTVCLDVTTSAPARIVVWATGINGADCAIAATLTAATAILDKADWAMTAALASGVNYIRTSDTANAQLTRITVSSELALSGSTCETTPGSGFSEVCKPSAGTARHYRIEGVQTAPIHTSAALFLGFASQPAGGTTAAGTAQAKIQVYHGDGAVGGAAPDPQANVDFSNEATNITSYTAYTSAAQTICFDVTGATPPRITLWATGTNTADCANRSTLTAANAILNKSTWMANTTALSAANVYYYRGSSVTTTKVIAYTTVMGTGF